jgi:chromosome segregation protein
MRLEKLTLHGFKSFADKVEFDFQKGLTAFVGPNGCGKSNVVDGVKWVLGEQSVKALRGNDMCDVIFNGTPTRRSRGYAEAVLTLSNTKGILATDYEKISVSRRLYRSGESEYYLNKQRCRLRDIREMFMDTGIGMDAYSIIEQGKVDALLTSNKQDRRAIFEEAAGISKYKSQKKSCISKLERVDNNLLRLGDIIDEVEKRMRSVKYQAAKARRWKRLDDDRRELAVVLALHKYDEFVTDRDATAAELKALGGEVDGLHSGIERLEAELSGLETAVIEADQKISALQSEDVRISSQLESAEQAVKMNERRIGELDDLEAATKAEMAKAEAAIELMRGELTRSETETSELDDIIRKGGEELAERRAAIRGIEEQTQALRRQIEEKRVEAVDLASDRAKQNNELSAIGAQRTQLLHQQQRLEGRANEGEGNLAECRGQSSELAQMGAELRQHIEVLERDQSATEQESEERAKRLEDLVEQINGKRSEIASANSRCELLADLEEKNEGISSGVKALKAAVESGETAPTGICGVVADLLDVDVAHAVAIEAALGADEQVVITETFDEMTRAIEFLGDGAKGKARFIALDRVEAGEDVLSRCIGLPGVVGRAMDFVRCSEEAKPALTSLLGDVLVVEDIARAKGLASARENGIRYATLDGQVVSARGVSVGGVSRGATGVISRRSELRALEAARASLDADLAVLGQQREEGIGAVERAKLRLASIGAELGKARSERSRIEAEGGKLNEFIGRLESEMETLRSERQEGSESIEMLGRREGEIQGESNRLEQGETELKAELAGQERMLGESEASRDQLRNRAAQVEVAQAQRIEKAESLRRRRDELGAQAGERERSLTAAREQVQSCGGRRAESHEIILTKKSEIHELLERRSKLGSEKAAADNQREMVRVEFDKKREARNVSSRRAKESDSRLNKLNVHAAEVAMRIENLEALAASEFECSLAERRAAGPIEERDWDEIGREIGALEQKIKSMGAVNTYAIEELEELEQRAAELTKQRDDLQKAENTLREIIRRINRRSREMFRQTYEDVRGNFQVLFRKLFGGGRADIVLEEDVDILDAGIEIVACPPGKEPASITLLSGGEKTMTAIALLFAIFQSKPSPFCILDEVDAALDESNIQRFCMMVREFLKDSQFLVVTHSRRTMAMADVLYGITMQEPGISTKVAVKFNDDKEAMVAGG